MTSSALTIWTNHWAAGALAQTPLEELTALPIAGFKGLTSNGREEKC